MQQVPSSSPSGYPSLPLPSPSPSAPWPQPSYSPPSSHTLSPNPSAYESPPSAYSSYSSYPSLPPSSSLPPPSQYPILSDPSSSPLDFPSQPTSYPPSETPSYPSSQSSSYPPSQPTSYPPSQPSSYPPSQPTSYPSSQPTPYPTSQPTSYPPSQPTSYPLSQPPSYSLSELTSYPPSQPASYPPSEPTSYPPSQPPSYPPSYSSSYPSTYPSPYPSSPLPPPPPPSLQPSLSSPSFPSSHLPPPQYFQGGGEGDGEGEGGVVAYHGGGTDPYGSRGVGSGQYWEPSSGENNTFSSGFSHNENNTFSVSESAKYSPSVDKKGSTGNRVDQKPTPEGAQRFTVKLVGENDPDGNPKTVMCQIALDGVKLLEPSTGKVLRVYPLETITSWAVKEPGVFTFWARSSVDVEQRTVRLQSNDYTTGIILDALTAACVQLFEMVGQDGQSGSNGNNPNNGNGNGNGNGNKGNNSNSDPKKNAGPAGLMEWMAAKAKAEEKEHWVPDDLAKKCGNCHDQFTPFFRKHHCRNCGGIFCDKCTKGRAPLTSDAGAPSVRVCDHCLAEVTQRLLQSSNEKPNVSRTSSQLTHEDLAKTLGEEIERNAVRKNEGQRGQRNLLNETKENDNSSFVLSCSNCGSVTIVTGNNANCPSCGKSSTNNSTPNSRIGASYGSATGNGVPQGPPHLWPDSQRGEGGNARSTREVACPTCTVHLQVEVPSAGTETVECGVCRNPFLVAA